MDFGLCLEAFDLLDSSATRSSTPDPAMGLPAAFSAPTARGKTMFLRKANDIFRYRLGEVLRGRGGIDDVRKMERMMEKEEFGVVYCRLLL